MKRFTFDMKENNYISMGHFLVAEDHLALTKLRR